MFQLGMVVPTMPSTKQAEAGRLHTSLKPTSTTLLRPHLKQNKRQRGKEIFLQGET